MTDKRNIVIKVKYPLSGKTTESSAPNTVTVWHVKRIALASSVALAVIVGIVFYFLNGDSDTGIDNAIEQQTAPPFEAINESADKPIAPKTNPSVKPIIEPDKHNRSGDNTVKDAVNKKGIKEHEPLKINGSVARAALTYAIKDKEPAGETVRTVELSGKAPVSVYYFTELKAMNGRKAYHEWLKNGVLVSRQKISISGDMWRTSSRKLFSAADKGNWTVRLVDTDNRLLNEKSFKVK